MVGGAERAAPLGRFRAAALAYGETGRSRLVPQFIRPI